MLAIEKRTPAANNKNSSDRYDETESNTTDQNLDNLGALKPGANDQLTPQNALWLKLCCPKEEKTREGKEKKVVCMPGSTRQVHLPAERSPPLLLSVSLVGREGVLRFSSRFSWSYPHIIFMK